ncbi:alpha/beta hydrolase [Amycolatopsis sp. NPDC051071]|uniref:alpha/beta fold hydrolase n=1 Tax=Amycolatopsis sp. NPDC051071 TaxID=3154637 RepID=UPI003415282A
MSTVIDVTLAMGEVTLRGTVTGTGPTVLLLHAGGEQRGVWAPISARLAKHGLRTTAFDLRGHGESTGQATTLRALAGDVAEMVSREPAPIVVVGASVGGLAAIAALAEPAAARRVAGLVLVDVVPDIPPVRARSWLDYRGLRGHYTYLVEDILGSGPALLATAGALDVPILLVRAGPDSPLSDADAHRLRTAARCVTVAHVPTAGHLVARDAPEELADIVSDHATRWLATEDVVDNVFALQQVLGAERIKHPGGTLLTHLRRVYALTVEWGASPRTRLAAICHASYGTDGFPHSLLPVTERQRLRQVIGSDAEALVYHYGACDRARTYRELGNRPLPVTDRFTGEPTSLQGAELHDFAVLTIANELDVARHARLPKPAVEQLRNLFTALKSYAPDEAALALAETH